MRYRKAPYRDDSTNGGDHDLANPSKVSIATDDDSTCFVVADIANNRVLEFSLSSLQTGTGLCNCACAL